MNSKNAPQRAKTRPRIEIRSDGKKQMLRVGGHNIRLYEDDRINIISLKTDGSGVVYCELYADSVIVGSQRNGQLPTIQKMPPRVSPPSEPSAVEAAVEAAVAPVDMKPVSGAPKPGEHLAKRRARKAG